MRDQFS